MTTTIEKPKRRPGRPKGYPRSGGRQKGTPNRNRAATIEKIMELADPLEFLCKVARGDRMSAASKTDASTKSWWVPTGDQRISAAQTLARKVLPDMKAVEISGEPVPITQIIRRIIDPEAPGKESERPAADNSAANGKDENSPAATPPLVHSSPTHEG